MPVIIRVLVLLSLCSPPEAKRSTTFFHPYLQATKTVWLFLCVHLRSHFSALLRLRTFLVPHFPALCSSVGRYTRSYCHCWSVTRTVHVPISSRVSASSVLIVPFYANLYTTPLSLRSNYHSFISLSTFYTAPLICLRITLDLCTSNSQFSLCFIHSLRCLPADPATTNICSAFQT